MRIIIILLLSFIAILRSEDAKIGWDKEMASQLNLSQASFDNWSAGGVSSYSYQLNFKFNVKYQGEHHLWENQYRMELGAAKIKDESFRKNVDNQKLVSRLAYLFSKNYSSYASLNIETQLLDGYEFVDDNRYEVSSLGRPGFWIFSLGGEYKIEEFFKLRGGAAFKVSAINKIEKRFDEEDNFLDLIKKKENNEDLGFEIGMDARLPFLEKFLYESQLEIFTQGFFSESQIKKTDVSWDHIFTASVTKYFNANVQFQILYDKDLSYKRQIRQFIALGLVFKVL